MPKKKLQVNLKPIARGEIVRVVVDGQGISIHRSGKLLPVPQQPSNRDVLGPSLGTKVKADIVEGDLQGFEVCGADRNRGAFVPPLLLLARDPKTARAIHEVEAFGPVATVMPYQDTADAIALARRGGGSLAASIFCADDSLARSGRGRL